MKPRASQRRQRLMGMQSIIIILFLLIAPGLFAQDAMEKNKKAQDLLAEMEGVDPLEETGAKFELRGFYKNLFMFQRVDEYYGDDFYSHGAMNMSADLNRLRLSPEFRYGKSVVLHVDYDNEMIFSSYNATKTFDAYWRPSGYNDFIQMNWELANRKEIYYRMKIHRAFAKIIAGDFTVTAGRQQIRFGTGRLWNPLDIMNPVSPTFIEGAEEQKGTDALMVDYFFNEKTVLTAVYNPRRYNDDFTRLSPGHANSMLRFKTTVAEVEMALLAGYISNRITGGGDVAANLFDGILRGSVIYAHPEDGAPFIQASAGYEYTFRNGIYFLAEYFFNQNGLNYNDTLKNIYLESLYTGIDQRNYARLSNQLMTFNQHYAGLALGYDFHPLLRGEFFSIYDFQGKGLFWTVSMKYNMRQNTDVNAGVMMAEIFGGRDSSDFAAIHRQYIYFLSLVIYF